MHFWKVIIFQIFLLVMLIFPDVFGIIGGYWKSVKSHPYLALVAYQRPVPCAGSIIMTNWILTAARCIHHGHVGVHGVLGVRIGVTNFDKDKGTFIRKKSLHTHPYFMSDASYSLSVNDIGLIQLAKHIEFGPHVHPIGVSFQHVAHNTSCLTMGWGIVNPNVYLSEQPSDPNFWPKKGENSLRDIEQQTSGDLFECRRVMRIIHRMSIHPDWHICAIHYPFFYNYPFRKRSGDGLDSNQKKMFENYMKMKRGLKMDKPKGKMRQAREENNTEVYWQKWYKKWWTLYHNYYEWDYGQKYLNNQWIDTPSYWWRPGYDRIRINTNGPSYYDYGGPLLCYGQQVGIFVFPVANVQMRKRFHYTRVWPPVARAVYTALVRYVPWIDTVIEMEYDKTENEPPPLQEVQPDQSDVWHLLNSSKSIVSNKIFYIFIIILIALNYK